MAGPRKLSCVVLFSGSDATHPVQNAAEAFAEAVKNRTNNELTVEVYPAKTLYSQAETIDKNVRGIIDMSLTTQVALERYVNAFAVVMLPFIYDNYDHAYRVLDGPFKDWVMPLLEAQQLKFLANWEWGFRHITNNVRPIKTPQDLHGIKMRVPPEMQLHAAFDACGAQVSESDLSGLYAALKEGTFDAQENPLAVIYHFKLYEVQKYLSLTHHAYHSMVHVMSLKSWKKLTPDQQQILTEESQKAGNQFRHTIRDQENDLLNKLRAKGMQVLTPDIESFRTAMTAAYKRIADYAGADNVQRFVEMVKTTRKSRFIS